MVDRHAQRRHRPHSLCCRRQRLATLLRRERQAAFAKPLAHSHQLRGTDRRPEACPTLHGYRSRQRNPCRPHPHEVPCSRPRGSGTPLGQRSSHALQPCREMVLGTLPRSKRRKGHLACMRQQFPLHQLLHAGKAEDLQHCGNGPVHYLPRKSPTDGKRSGHRAAGHSRHERNNSGRGFTARATAEHGRRHPHQWQDEHLQPHPGPLQRTLLQPRPD